MPLICSAVYEDSVRCKVVVVVDDIAKISARFVAFSGVWDEEFVIRLLV